MVTNCTYQNGQYLQNQSLYGVYPGVYAKTQIGSNENINTVSNSLYAQGAYSPYVSLPYTVPVAQPLRNQPNAQLNQLQTDEFQKTYSREFEDVYQNYCTLDAVKRFIPMSAILNQDFNKEKEHFHNTYAYSLKLANKLGLSDNEKEMLKYGAIMHDIGKSLVPSAVLNKPDKLNFQEKILIDMHAPLGYELAKHMQMPDGVLNIIKNHHENKTGDKLAEITKIADRFDALTMQRSYKKAFSREKAFEILDEEAQKGQIDPNMWAKFKECV